MNLSLPLKSKKLFLFFIPLILISCKVMLVGAYDEVTDLGIQKVQNDISTIIVKLERNIDNNTPALNDYKNFTAQYETIAGEMETLRIRCISIKKYDLVLQQVTLLKSNIADLEKLHKLGITDKGLLNNIKTNFEFQFSAIIKLQNGLKRQKNPRPY